MRPRGKEARAVAPEDIVILGIDPGLRVTGWGIVGGAGQEFRALASGTVAPDPGLPTEARLHHIFRELCAVIERCRPAEVAIEDPFVAKNARSAFAIGEARAVGLLAAAQAGLPVRAYAPAEVKLAVTGHGRSDKAQVQKMVRLQLALAEPPKSADAADALAVALCHHLRRRTESRIGATA